MGVSFSSLVENERTVKIDVNGERLTVTYSPRNMTGPRLEKLAEAIQAAHEDDAPDATVNLLAELFCGVVSAWNLEGPIEGPDGNEVVPLGAPVPLMPEFVAHLPGPIVEYLIEKLREDCRPNPQKRRA